MQQRDDDLEMARRLRGGEQQQEQQQGTFDCVCFLFLLGGAMAVWRVAQGDGDAT